MNLKFFRIPVRMLFYLPDLLIGLYFILSYRFHRTLQPYWLYEMFGIVAMYLFIKTGIFFLRNWAVYTVRIRAMRELIANFKKGRYAVRPDLIDGNDAIAQIFKDLTIVGHHFDDILSSQKGEIEKFRELYNNIVLSVSSYFIVLNERNEIIFANESFCKNFQYTIDEILKRKISDIFYFTAGKVEDAIEKARRGGQSEVLKSMRIMSKNRVAIIADIKVSLVKVQGENQVVFLMDDITAKARKDYQINLISQISESIQRDDEIEQVLRSILTAVTSGSGLGFNRAMLFLCDDLSYSIVGKMAVGPDSFEEAIEIWGAVLGKDLDIIDEMKGAVGKGRKGMKFYEKVVGTVFPLDGENVFVEALRSQKNVHVKDAWNDPRLSKEIREFMDVNEFIISPLIAGSRAIGIIVADNKYNQAPIWHDSIELLSIFSVQAALSIESCNSLSMVREQMGKIRSRQEAIVESEKLAAVGRIAAHIAHEIRNPLVTVGGYARRILQQSKQMTKGGESIRHSAQVILQETERLEKTLSNVMDFTRPSTYIQDYNNLNDIILDTVDLLKNVFQERKIECELDLRDNLPLIKSDYNQLKQVILNLYQNSMDAMDGGGVLYTSTSLNESGSRVMIVIGDTGSGLKEEHVDRLFDPFFTTKVTGVGLGLAVVKKIISDHNGEITARNLPQGGAEFRIEITAPKIDS
jgi:PAS domain S-box-containing protein